MISVEQAWRADSFAPIGSEKDGSSWEKLSFSTPSFKVRQQIRQKAMGTFSAQANVQVNKNVGSGCSWIMMDNTDG